jgi:outer membrane protein TolC
MHLPPESPLPPPPGQLTLAEALPAVEELRVRALEQRPDLKALAKRLVAEEASWLLAKKEFYPDFELLAAYDTFWQAPQQALQPQVGLRLNLPVQKEKRRAAVMEAEARIAERRAQLNRQFDQVNFQLQEAYEQVVESEQSVRLYDKTILPTAKSNVEAARSAYEANRTPFLTLIEAQRNRVGLLDAYYQEIADYFQRRAALERAVGGPIGPTTAPPSK